MSKKKTKKATTKKPSAKVKTQTITTENFGELVLKHDYEKDIIIKTNELMTARKKSDNIIVELGIAIQPYLLKNKKVTLDMKTVKQYVFDLVGYQKGNIKKSTFAKTNEGFEADVSRAVKLAFVSTSRKNTGIYIDEKTKSIKGISKKVHPVLEVKTPDGKDFKPHKNNSAEILDNIKIDRVMKAFDEVIMGKNISNKKTSKATPKDNKVKTVTIDTKINDVMNFTAELNACSVKDLADKYKGTTQKRLVQIALNVLRLEAKKTNEKISENGNVKNDNEILFSGKTQNIITWNKASWKNAVTDLSQQPKVANK
jgi:hypothetical protein